MCPYCAAVSKLLLNARQPTEEARPKLAADTSPALRMRAPYRAVAGFLPERRTERRRASAWLAADASPALRMITLGALPPSRAPSRAVAGFLPEPVPSTGAHAPPPCLS